MAFIETNQALPIFSGIMAALTCSLVALRAKAKRKGQR